MTTPSSGVAICSAASDVGVDLRGARFLLFSEPLTVARRRVIESAGVTVIARYASTECRPIAYGCQAPAAADDPHLLHELQVAVQPGSLPAGTVVDGPGLPPSAVLLTSLRRMAPLILLNVSLGDQAQLSQRACGCPLEGLGWTTHLQDVRSFDKLTAGGMTFLDVDVIRVLEELLPSRFGGGPTDYQLVEEETAGGRPVLRLLAHPNIGPLDERAVVEAFLEAIGTGRGVQHLMALAWREGDYIRLERRPPLATVADKIQHLHVRI